MQNNVGLFSPIMVIILVQFIIDPRLIADPRGSNLGARDRIMMLLSLALTLSRPRLQRNRRQIST